MGRYGVTLAAVALDSWQLPERLRSTTTRRTLREVDGIEESAIYMTVVGSI